MNSCHFAESMGMIREYAYWMQDHPEDWNEDIAIKVYMPLVRESLISERICPEKITDKISSTNVIEAIKMGLALHLA